VKTQNLRKHYTLAFIAFFVFYKILFKLMLGVRMNRTRTKHTKKGVSHLRVSAPGQKRSGLGIAAQRRIIAHYFKVNNIILVKEFVEYGSGRPRKRPKAQKTIDYCRKYVLTLYVANQSRFARNVGFIYDQIESKFDFINIESPYADKYQKIFQALIDEKTGDDISNNTKNALLSAAKKGIKFGGNSKKRLRTLKRKKRVYLKKIRHTIRREQKKFKTVRSLRDRLNRMRLRKRNGKRAGWSVSEVHEILHDLKKLK
jgi:DNA invertase Pin-like site-specific DNA recombinase